MTTPAGGDPRRLPPLPTLARAHWRPLALLGALGAAAPLATIYGYDRLAEPRRADRTRRRLRDAIDWSVHPRTGVVSFTVSAPSPELATALANSLLAERAFWEDRARLARADVDSAELLLRDPTLPVRPSRPRLPIAILVGLMIGMSLGAARVVLRG